MAIDKVAAVARAGTAPAQGLGLQRFPALAVPASGAGPRVAPEGGLSSPGLRALPGAQQARSPGGAAPGRSAAGPALSVESAGRARAEQWLDRVSHAQQRLDHILHLAESGKSFSPVELLSFQAHVYRASQELDLAGKVVEKATGGVKQVLQTQL